MVLDYSQLQKRLRPEIPWGSRLVIEPFLSEEDPASAVAASIDFHLGNRFTLLRSRRDVQHDPLSKFSPITSDRRQLGDIVTRELFIPMGEAFTIHPGQIVLGTTLEWYRFPEDLVADVIGRSIWGRRGLLIVTAQTVHPLSSGTITLEMCNLGEVGLRLRPGVSIGQLVFHKVQGSEDKQDPAKVRKYSKFAGTLRPSLGEYKPSDVESFLLWQLE